MIQSNSSSRSHWRSARKTSTCARSFNERLKFFSHVSQRTSVLKSKAVCSPSIPTDLKSDDSERELLSSWWSLQKYKIEVFPNMLRHLGRQAVNCLVRTCCSHDAAPIKEKVESTTCTSAIEIPQSTRFTLVTNSASYEAQSTRHRL